jgi:hypothetical protein
MEDPGLIIIKYNMPLVEKKWRACRDIPAPK